MPGQALLKATLLKETYVPLVDLNGAEKNHVVVRVLPSRLSIMERRFLDQIAPKVFPVREQFNELRHAARLQKAGFQVQDVINVYERLLAAGANSKGFAAAIANVDEDFPFSQVELHQLIYTPKQNADDVDCDRAEQPAPTSPPVSTPKDTLTNYRHSILENVMFQLEEKWRETSLDDTEHMSGSQNAAETTEADPGRTHLATGGTADGRSAQEDDCDTSTSSWSSEGSNHDSKASPTFHHSGSLHSGSLEISFNIPVARGSPEGSVSAVLTSGSWRCYLGCYSDSPSGTVSRGRSAATSTASMIITGSPAMGSADTKRRESVVAAVVRPTIIEGKANVGESHWETSSSHMSPHESRNSLRKLLVSSDPLISADESQASTQDFASSPINSTDEYDEVKGERSLMSLWRRSRLDNGGEGHAEQSNGNQTDERDQHLADVEKSGSDGLRIGTKRVSPSRLSQSNSSTKSSGEAQNLSETPGKSQSTKEPAVLSDAAQDVSDGRRANVENSSARVHGDSKRRSIQSPVRSPIRSPSGRSPSFLESLSITETAEAKKDSKNSSRRAGVQNKISNSPSRSHGDSPHRSPSRAAPTFLRSLSTTETGVFSARVKPDFSSRKADLGVSAEVPSSSDESLRGSRNRPLERFSNFFRRSQSMKETTLPIASASKKAIETIQGMPEARSPSQTTRPEPVVDSTPSGTASKQSRDDKGPTDSHGEHVHDNSSNASSLTLVTYRNIAQPALKLSPKQCRPRLRTLIDDARDQEFEQEIDDFFAKTTSTCSFIATLKRMIGCSHYHKGQFRMKRFSSPRLDGVDPVNNSTKGRVRKSTDAQISPKRSVHKSGTLIKRKTVRSPGRSSPGRVFPGRSSPGRLSPGRSSPGRLSPGRSSPGRLSPGRSSFPSRLSPGRLFPGRSSPGRLSPSRSSPGRLSPGRSSPGRLSPGRSSPGRLSPGRSSPGRSPGRASPGRSSPGRSPRSSPNRLMMSPNRKADRGRHARTAVKPVDDIMQRTSPNRSLCDELAWPEEVSTDNIHSGWLPDGRSCSGVSSGATRAVNAEGRPGVKTSPGRNQTGMEKVHPTPGHRQLRSRSTATRFLREYMERQEEVVQS